MAKQSQEPVTSRNAITGEVHDLAYWGRMLQSVKRDGGDEKIIRNQIDRLLDAKLAAR